VTPAFSATLTASLRESACEFIESTVTADVFAKKHDAALGHQEAAA
jgi:hypothetical protein